MFKNYVKIAFRNLAKNKLHSLINIVGLSTGMAVAILIGLGIHDELSFNRSFLNCDRIAQVLVRHLDLGQVDINRTLPMPLGAELRSSYSDDFKWVVLTTHAEEYVVSYGESKFTLPGSYMQPEATDMFSLNMVSGSRSGLKDPHSVLLSESSAKRIFGNTDPVNKIIEIDNRLDVKVTGVYEDFAHNTQFNGLAFIAPWDLLVSSSDSYKRRAGNWTDNFLHAYVQLQPFKTFESVSRKIKYVKRDHETRAEAADKPEVFLHPMNRWHLYSKFENGVNVTSPSLQSVWLNGIIGAFVLLLACINFMNLSTARSAKRAKEVGIRKAIGSLRSQLIGQFFGESLLIVGIAFVFSLLLAQLMLPWFNQVTDKSVSILWASPVFWLVGICFTIVTGLIAGSYPALYLSSFEPVSVLKGTWRAGQLASIPRKILVVVQFTVSVSMIIGTMVVYRQIQFSMERPVGYNRSGLIYLNMKTGDIHKHHLAFREDLLSTGAVTEVGESDGTINELWSNNGGFNWKGKDPHAADQVYFGTIGVSADFGKTVDWKVIVGRDFSSITATDSNALVINEAAAKYMHLERTVDESIQWGNRNFRVIGVIKDVLMESPYQPVTPTVFFLGPWAHATVSIRMNPNISTREALTKIEAVFKKYVASMPFDYTFADTDYGKKFAAEDRVARLAGFSAMLAIGISCLGIFGLASFVAEQRTKEIGIRKVIGASVINIWQMLSKDFVRLVIISCLIAFPISYYFLHAWLQKYAYHTNMTWWIFAATIAGVFIITLLTVSFQAIKAALANPVRSLRHE